MGHSVKEEKGEKEEPLGGKGVNELQWAQSQVNEARESVCLGRSMLAEVMVTNVKEDQGTQRIPFVLGDFLVAKGKRSRTLNTQNGLIKILENDKERRLQKES